MLTITRTDGYEISSDPDRLDLHRVHHWLSIESYWAKGRAYEVTVRAVAGSMPFGVYRPGDGVQVAFGRIVTDGATFAWLGDVFVDSAHRGLGLGGWLAQTARDAVFELGVSRILLATNDAHGVYARLGFTPPAKPDTMMELVRPRHADADRVTPVTDKERLTGSPLTVTE
ncbi:GNAT family N-acetyltransferase [Micromonospora sp. NBC_01699]|uniref:GNAT family N-acetyltransferase n=1 Tax=Micromonospora sp. NBC_01699 TaxID=2975984 RepID=UPI002E2DA094|nr:GNAT family N-acetyltransferase [Micromonospora sp. NBC_01699]